LPDGKEIRECTSEARVMEIPPASKVSEKGKKCFLGTHSGDISIVE
jgi:hypothetical protein